MHHYNKEEVQMATGCYSNLNVRYCMGIKCLHSVLALHSFLDWSEDETPQGCVLYHHMFGGMAPSGYRGYPAGGTFLQIHFQNRSSRNRFRPECMHGWARCRLEENIHERDEWVVLVDVSWMFEAEIRKKKKKKKSFDNITLLLFFFIQSCKLYIFISNAV